MILFQIRLEKSVNMPVLADVVNYFDTKPEHCDNWIRILGFIKESYNLNDNDVKILFSMKLKGLAIFATRIYYIFFLQVN